MKSHPFKRRVSQATFGGASALAASLLLSAAVPVHAEPNAADGRFPMSVEAMEAKRAEMFARIDVDGDGLISVAEFDAHTPRAHGGRRSGATDLPPGPGGRGGPGGGRERPSAEEAAAMDGELFEQLDSNDDGVLSRDEFSREAMLAARSDVMKSQRFAAADSNNDGYLSPDEFPPGHAADLDTNADGQISREELRAQFRPKAS